MANPRARKTASTRTAVKADDPVKSTDSTDEEVEEAAPVAKTGAPAKAAKAAKSGTTAKSRATAKSSATAKSAKSTAAAKATKSTGAAASNSRRFGDGASAAGARKKSPPTKSSGRGGRGGRPAPAVRVAPPKPWGMIAATVAVLVFAAGVIGYAVFQANSNAAPESPSDIDGITIAEYAAGQEHVRTDETYPESPPVGGPHDGIWADCDGAIYDQQIRSENALHSLEHGAVWITYNPDDISDDDLSLLSQYVQDQPYIMLSPYDGLESLISLQSWNHQLFVDSVDDSRINDFIQVLRQNPEEYPEVGATCSQPAFLADPVLEGEQSRDPQGTLPVVTDAPTSPTP